MPQNGLHQKPESLCLCRVFYPFNPVRRNPKTCVTHRNGQNESVSLQLFNWVWFGKWDNGSVLDMHSVWLDLIYLVLWIITFLPPYHNMSLSLPAWWYLLLFFISAFYLWRSHHFLWVKEKANEERDFVICMQRENRSYLPNMRAIQCNLAMIRRNVSIPSPYASYMMDGVFLW